MNKLTKNTQIIDNKYLKYEDNISFPSFIDFPQTSKLNSRVIYACIFDASTAYIKGVLRIDTTDFANAKPDIFLFGENEYGNAEAQIVVIDGKEYMMMFTDKNKVTSISLIDVVDKSMQDINIPRRIPPGFHSIFY